MAAFSYQHPNFVSDSFLVPNTSNNMSSFLHQATIITPKNCVSTMLPDNSSNECFQEIPLLAQTHETINPLHKINCRKGNKDPNSSPTMAEMADGDQLVTEEITSAREMKRKNLDLKEIYSRKLKVGNERGGEKERKNKRHAKKQKKVVEDAPCDYVHVRARRGQATDSHSLAERVRRAKISVRMKLLQSLVPGCDKITGKAQILDEIIKYIQTLQTQADFLAAKLSSVSAPMFNDFQVDFNTNPLHQEDNGNLLWDTDHDHSRTQELANQICMDSIIDNHIFCNYQGN